MRKTWTAGCKPVSPQQLNEYLRDTGLFFPIDPGADASLAAWRRAPVVPTRALRHHARKRSRSDRGLADDRIKTGGRAKKSAAGYDLTG